MYQSELDKACFPHDITYSDVKDLSKRAASDKVFHEKAFKNLKYEWNERGFTSMVYKCFDKKSTCNATRGVIKNEICQTKT